MNYYVNVISIARRRNEFTFSILRIVHSKFKSCEFDESMENVKCAAPRVTFASGIIGECES